MNMGSIQVSYFSEIFAKIFRRKTIIAAARAIRSAAASALALSNSSLVQLAA